jgi:Universal stress protein family
MYDRILVAIDTTPTEENRSAQTRAEQIRRLTGATVYVLHAARGTSSRVTSSAARASACAPPTRTSKAITRRSLAEMVAEEQTIGIWSDVPDSAVRFIRWETVVRLAAGGLSSRQQSWFFAAASISEGSHR